MNRSRFALHFACGVAALSCLAHCSSERSPGSAPPVEEQPPPLLSEPTSDAAGECLVHCSDDLREVVDCQGQVVTRCEGTTACGSKGKCVTPCESAALNRSNVGCEFVVPRPVGVEVNACFAITLTNTWTEPAAISVRFGAGGELFDLSKSAKLVGSLAPLPDGKIPPGEVAVIALAASEAGVGGTDGKCGPGLAPLLEDHRSYRKIGRVDTGRTSGFIVTSDMPLSVHAHDPFILSNIASKSAALLSASSAWGVDYVLSGPVGDAEGAWVQLVASEDGTAVEIAPSQAVAGGYGLPGVPVGEVRAFTLARGEVAQFHQASDLTGTLIHANKPIGAFSGAMCFYMHSQQNGGCDASNTQLMPVSALGNRYAGVRCRDRFPGVTETSPWRIVGAVDGTKLTFEPAPPPNAPLTLGAGEYFEFETESPFVVSSQDAEHPFSLFAFMTGAAPYSATDGGNPADGRGDPEFTQVIATGQYQRKYLFYTDSQFPETNLVVIRARGASGFADVSLDCAGVLAGFAPLGTSGEYEYVRIDLSRGNFEKVGNCSNGTHEIHSVEPFTATAWGWGSLATGTGLRLPDGGVDGRRTIQQSYAYPVGAGFKPINSVSFSGLE